MTRRRTFRGYEWGRVGEFREPRLSESLARAAKRMEREMNRTRRSFVFRGPHELACVWRALAEARGARAADEEFARRLGMSRGEVAYRRRQDMWFGVDWTHAVEVDGERIAHATTTGAAIVRDVSLQREGGGR